MSSLVYVYTTCHDHGALATGGMAAALHENHLEKNVFKAKNFEVSLGVDGFLIYDLKFLPCLNKISFGKSTVDALESYDDHDLLSIPAGQVTKKGLEKNIKVGILFIASWMNGQGTFILDGSVEDSATAEISRFQVWQWIKHEQKIDNDQIITFQLVQELSKEILQTIDHEHAKIGHDLFLELVQDCPQFVTTWLNERSHFKCRFFA